MKKESLHVIDEAFEPSWFVGGGRPPPLIPTANKYFVGK